MKNILSYGERFILLSLILIALFQFSQWSYQTLKYLLGLFLHVEIAYTTFLDPIIGIITLIGSFLLLVGAFFRWKERVSSQTYLLLGLTLFLFKNIFEILGEVLSLRQKYEIISEQQLEQLLSNINGEFFQIIIWALLLFYFARQMQKKPLPINTSSKPSSEEEPKKDE